MAKGKGGFYEGKTEKKVQRKFGICLYFITYCKNIHIHPLLHGKFLIFAEKYQLMKKRIINVRVNLNECEIVSKKDIHKKRKRHTIRHFSVVDEREIKQTAARELLDKIVNSFQTNN